MLRYEDFVATPQAALEQVRAFAGIDAAAFASTDAPPAVADLRAEPWKTDSVNAPVRAARSKFDDMFGPQLRAWLRQHLRDYDSVSAELRQRQIPSY